MKKLYLGLAFVGTVWPYAHFVPFLMTHGLDLALFVQQAFANQIASFFAADLLVSWAVFWVFAFHEAARLRIKGWWICLVANLVVGLSLALPLFLWMRERQRDRRAPQIVAAAGV
jgi:FtsH-binding integral membrane protein